MVLMNNAIPPFDNKLVRQAVSHAIDWQTIVEHDRVLAMSPITSLAQSFATLAWLGAALGVALVIGLWALLYRLIREEPSSAKRKDTLSLGL